MDPLGKRICTICARGGSKGVPNKNIRDICGRPLLAYTIEQALLSDLFDVVVVSSDSDEILRVASQFPEVVLVKRPAELASDKSSKIPAIWHALMQVEMPNSPFQTIVDLDPTSPLRLIDDIKNAVYELEGAGCGNLITGTPSHRSPYFNLVEIGSGGNVYLSKMLDPPITCRQDSPPCFDMNASVYVWRRDSFGVDIGLFQADTRIYAMPPERSIDIDSELDFEMVEFLMTRNTNSKKVRNDPTHG